MGSLRQESSAYSPEDASRKQADPFDPLQDLPRFQKLPEVAINCLKQLYRLLATPPIMHDLQLRDRAWRLLLQEMINRLHVLIPEEPAVSVFLVSDDGQRLDCVAGTGYKPESKYESTTYATLYKSFTTTHVFHTHAAKPEGLNMSRSELDESMQRYEKGEPEGIPFTGKCDDILRAKLTRLIATPVALPSSKCFGVLKIEGWTGRPETRFLDADFGLARVFASNIAAACQLRLYWQLSDSSRRAIQDTRTLSSFAHRIAEVLAEGLNAECSTIFLVQKGSDPTNPEFRTEAAFGYAASADFPNERKEFLRFVTSRQTARIFANESEVHGFSDGWHRCYPGGKFRNALAVPLLDRNGICIGLLLLENKLPVGSSFDALDMDLCLALAEQIKPTLEKYLPRSEPKGSDSPGYQHLLNSAILSDADFERINWPETARRLIAFRNEASIEITVDDLVRFSKIPRSTFYKLLGPTVAPESNQRTQRARKGDSSVSRRRNP